MTELLLARGTVAELHREAFAGQGHRGGEPSGSFCWRGAAAKVLNGREHCGRDLSGRSCWPGAARFVAGQGAMAERLQRGGAMAELLLAGRREVRKGRRGAAWGTLRVRTRAG